MQNTENKNMTLPDCGFVRWKQLQHLLPFSREYWRQLILAGRAPTPIKHGNRCVMFRVEDIREFLNDINNYKANKNIL